MTKTGRITGLRHVKTYESESEVAQSCPTPCDPMDCSLPGSSVHGIFQARELEWVAISFSKGSSQPRDQTHVSCIASRRFYHLSHQGSCGKETHLPMQEMKETQVGSLGWGDPLKKGTATHASILAWRIPWTEEPSRLQSIGLRRAGHD